MQETTPPDCTEMVPAGHAWQGAPGAYWKNPSAQGVQEEADRAPALAEYRPEGQDVHNWEPADSE